MTRISSAFLSLLLLGGTMYACADPASEPPAAVKQVLKTLVPDHRPDDIRPAPLAGYFEVRYGTDIFYISSDGRYAFHGDIVDIPAQINLTENRRSELRKALFGKLDGEQPIIFAPRAKPKHVIYVFTDVDCTFCRRFHSEITQYNDRGIEVRYLAYPRSGADTPSYFKAVAVWCANDRRAALTRAKAGENLPAASCKNPVLEHMALAEQFGVSGTPTLILPDGSSLPGYVPPAQLAAYLDQQFPTR